MLPRMKLRVLYQLNFMTLALEQQLDNQHDQRQELIGHLFYLFLLPAPFYFFLLLNDDLPCSLLPFSISYAPYSQIPIFTLLVLFTILGHPVLFKHCLNVEG